MEKYSLQVNEAVLVTASTSIEADTVTLTSVMGYNTYGPYYMAKTGLFDWLFTMWFYEAGWHTVTVTAYEGGRSTSISFGVEVMEDVKISLSETTVTFYNADIEKGQNTFRLDANVTGTNSPVIWQSSDPSVASVSGDGSMAVVTLYYQRLGKMETKTVVITATVEGKSAVCVINVIG